MNVVKIATCYIVATVSEFCELPENFRVCVEIQSENFSEKTRMIHSTQFFDDIQKAEIFAAKVRRKNEINVEFWQDYFPSPSANKENF